MRDYDPTRPLVSLHVPKTAGTSLRLALETWFRGDALKLHYQDTTTLRVPPHQALHGGTCIHGHFDAARGYGVDDYYPDAEQFIVFLRDPFERAISLYFFIRGHHSARGPRGWLARVGRPVDGDDFMPFDRWIPFLLDEQAAGRSAAYPWYFPKAPDVAAITSRMAHDFVFVGLSETYGASLRALGRILAKPPAKERYVNRTRRPSRDLSHWRRDHEAAFADEYEIYERGREANAEILRTLR